MADVIDAPERLRLVAVNGQNIPYIGWMEVTFDLASNEVKTDKLVIPVLVMRGSQLRHPIIGYNVIEQMVNDMGITQPMTSGFQGTTCPSPGAETVQAFIKQIHAETPCEYTVKTTKENVHVPKNTSVQVECRVQSHRPKEDILLIFEPDVNPQWTEGLEFCETIVTLQKHTSPGIIVQNPTDYDLMLMSKTVIGTVRPVQSVYPTAAFENHHGLPSLRISQIKSEASHTWSCWIKNHAISSSRKWVG